MHMIMRYGYNRVLVAKWADANREPRQRDGESTDPNNEWRQANTQKARVQILMTKCKLYCYSRDMKCDLIFASLIARMHYLYTSITRKKV